jgi:hypothetical protein
MALTKFGNVALTKFGKVKVSDLLHFSAVKIQVKHLDHFFRIYIKVLDKDTIYRVEEPKQPKVPPLEFIKILAVEYINDIFNPVEKIGKQLFGISERLDKLTSFQSLADNRGA